MISKANGLLKHLLLISLFILPNSGWSDPITIFPWTFPWGATNLILGQTKDSSEVKDIKAKWQPVADADPSKHDPKRFRYLIHGIGLGMTFDRMQNDIARSSSKINVSHP